MNKQQKRKWLKAIKKLEQYYSTFKLDDIPESYGMHTGRACPLCLVCKNWCRHCLWVKYDKRRCTGRPFPDEFWKDSVSSYGIHTASQRLRRLIRWKKRIKKEK